MMKDRKFGIEVMAMLTSTEDHQTIFGDDLFDAICSKKLVLKNLTKFVAKYLALEIKDIEEKRLAKLDIPSEKVSLAIKESEKHFKELLGQEKFLPQTAEEIKETERKLRLALAKVRLNQVRAKRN